MASDKMNNLTKVNQAIGAPVQGNSAEITISGDNNSFVAHADAVENNITLVLNDPRSRRGENRARITFNTAFYHLFVVAGENYEDDFFIVPKNKALTESTDDILKARYAALAPEAIESLRTYPAVFASDNHGDGKTDEWQDAYFGFVKDIKVQDNGIKIYFTIITAIPQQILNERCAEFGIAAARSNNELNQTHWALKQINLISALDKAGIQLI